MPAPLRYSPSLEVIKPDEGEVQRELAEQMLKISAITCKDEKEALRSVHAKSHGIVEGTLTVAPHLPPHLAQGLFARAGAYKVILRLSSTPGDLVPDSVSTPRGLAIKVLDVPGERLAGDASRDQDFLLATGKAFGAPDAKSFLKNVKMLAATTDKGEGLKVALSNVFRRVEETLELAGGQSATLKSLGGYPAIHILGESFFSQAPIRFGDHVAKIGVFPVSKELTGLTGAAVNLEDGFDPLRQQVRNFFAGDGGAWELRAQLCTNTDDMPIEDASVPWPEEESPYVTVARIEVPVQESWSDERSLTVDKGMAFNPWHCLAAHQPLGGVNRARKPVYAASSEFRLSRCPVHHTA